MQVERLVPCPEERTQFAWSHRVAVPDVPGCYALATYAGTVLYVGLATVSMRSRMEAHLDTRAKRKGADAGVPFWFYYHACPAPEVTAMERGWMNQAILDDGEIPPLNKVFSPM